MSLAPRKKFLAKATSSKERPSGTENQCPSPTVKRRKQQVPRIFAVPCTNENRTKSETIVGSVSCQKGHAIANTLLSAKKPQFDVHCDENNAAQPQLRPRRSSAAEPGTSKATAFSASSRDQRIDRIQPALGIGERNGLSRKLSQEDRPVTEERQSRRNGKALVSKIPRRARSNSTNSVTKGFPPRPLSKVAAPLTTECACLVANQTYTTNHVATETRDAYNNDTPNADATVQRKCGKNLVNQIVDSIDSIHSAVFPKITSTPVKNVSLPKKRSFRLGAVICNADYHADLPIVEWEKENLSPRLSAKFLKEHVNAEQRKIIVIFLLRLGTHCNFSSYVIYRAVKIFDAAIDRIEVGTAFIQVTALASLWIALKLLERSEKIPTASAMISLAKDLYAGKQHLLIEYERKILRVLDYNVSFVDAYTLLSYHLINYSFSSDISQDMIEFLFFAASYAIDVTLLDESFCKISVSFIAAAAVELVLGLVLDTDQNELSNTIRPRWLFWRGFLHGAAAGTGFRFMDRFQNAKTDRYRVAILRCIQNSDRKGSGFESVHRKYSRSRYGRIAKPLLDLAAKLSPSEFFDP
ncbi:uncharacterized protein LOC144471265 [Augochlora pura]